MEGYKNIGLKNEDYEALKAIVEAQGFKTFAEFFRDIIRKYRISSSEQISKKEVQNENATNN